MKGVILCRRGSVGLPGKNMRYLGGRPLCEWVIRTAMKSSALDEVIVLTDWDEVAEVARRWGAHVNMRGVSGATESGFDVLRWYGLDEEIVMLQCTSPFTAVEDVDAVACMEGCVVSVVRESRPLLDGSGKVVSGDCDYRSRQAAGLRYLPNGALLRLEPWMWERLDCWTKVESIRLYEMPEERSIDIDTKWDLRLAEGSICG
jgi:N-acylneuraminate cytidylyltransferase